MADANKRKFIGSKRARRITAACLSAFIAIAALVSVAWFAGLGTTERYVADLVIDRSAPEGIETTKNAEYGYAEINVTRTDELKILQLSDLHIGCGFLSVAEDKKLINEIVKCVNAVNPDLIAITGDALSPVFVTSGTRNSYRQTAVLTALFEKLKVPYAFCFGNHDGDGTAGKAYVAEKLEAAPYSLFLRGDRSAGEGNYCVKVKFGGDLVSSLIFIDSGMSAGAGKYEGVSKSGVKSYEEIARKLKEENPTASNLLFMHVPVPEYDDFYNAAKRGDPDYRLISGIKDEKVACGEQNGLYDAIVKTDFTKWVFCGHDHKNNYSVKNETTGVTLCYGMSMDFSAYPTLRFKTGYRGGRVIKIAKSGEVTTFLVPQSNGYSA